MLWHDPIEVRFVTGRWVQTVTPMRWWGRYPATVPAGFVSDGGSIPSLAWPLVGHPLSARLLACFLLHDHELRDGLGWADARRRLDARLRDVRCPTARRWLIVAGVTLHGWLR